MDITNLGLVRRSEKRNLRPLTELSLQTIVLNIDRYASFDEPFACLPSDVMTVLIETQRQYRKSQSGPLHAHKYKMHCTDLQMISWNTQRVYLEAFGWEAALIESLLKKIMFKCADTLLSLSLSYCSPQVFPTLQRLVPRLLSIRKLEVIGRLGNDALLAVIGEHLDQLRDLYMDSSTITDCGLASLCVPHKTLGRCKRLQSVRLNSTNQVSSLGVLSLLEHLPDLRLVHHRQLVKAVFMFAHKHSYRTLRLEGEVFGKKEKLKITPENLRNFLRTVPNLKTMNFLHDMLSSTSKDQLQEAKNIETLEINVGIIPLKLSQDMVVSFSAKLRCLKIESVGISVDISVIAKYCTYLQELHYRCKTAYSLEHPIVTGAFAAIRTVIIEDLTGNIPDFFLHCIITSEHLELLSFVRTHKLKDELLEQIFRQAKTDVEIFSKLKLIQFCFIPDISVTTMQHFICLAPLLESLEVTACNNIDSQGYTALLQFIIDMGWEDELELL